MDGAWGAAEWDEHTRDVLTNAGQGWGAWPSRDRTAYSWRPRAAESEMPLHREVAAVTQSVTFLFLLSQGAPRTWTLS